MNNKKFLSEQTINLNELVTPNSTFDFFNTFESLNWLDCPITKLTRGAESTHFYIVFNNSATIPMDNTASCVLKKVEGGYFSDCYAIVERSLKQRITTVYVIIDNKILRFISENRVMFDDEIDHLFSNENIAKITAKVIREYNVTKPRQTCQSYCENLPTQCYMSRNFLRDVVGNISKTPMNIIGTYNPEIVKINVCTAKNLDIFKKCLAETRKEMVCCEA